MSYVVYVHTNRINGKRYVGITSDKPEKRWRNGYGYRGQVFYSAIEKYGWEEFSHEILFTNLSKKEAEEKEIYLISKWKTSDVKYGYNRASGGCVNSGFHISDEEKKRRSDFMRKRPILESTRDKLSKAMSGKRLSDEVKNKISKSKKGRKLSEATKHKMSESRTGSKHFASIPITQFDDYGNKIAEYTNSREAEFHTGICSRNIRNCINGKRKHAGGYVWTRVDS